MQNLKPLRDSMPIQTITWTVPLARHALQELEMGYLNQAAMLADSMTRDDRISATLRTRTRALLGLPRAFVPVADTRAARKTATTLETDFDVIAPEETITALMRWAVLLGVAVAELVWERKVQGDSSRWIPRLKVWHPQFLYYRWDTRTWQIQTQDGIKEVVAGNGQWLLLQLGSQRPWMEGLVRELTIPYLARQFAIRDFLRYSEFHGQPTKIAKVPTNSTEEDRKLFFNSIRRLGREPLIKMVQPSDKSADGYDFSYLEAKANTWTGFRALIDQMDTSIAISVLGQNLTTQVNGGSRSAAEVHERKEFDVVKSDVALLETALYEQVFKWWMSVNFGSLDAPWLKHDTEPAEDAKLRAETLNIIADVIPKLRAANIDTAPLLAAYDLQALETVAPPPASKLNLKLVSTQFADNSGLVNGQLYTDDISDGLINAGLLESDLQAIQNIIANATDYDGLRAALLEKYKDMNPEQLRELLEQALTLTNFAGRLAVQDDL
jgi:phage gp29-like protein